jgi:hypothetical protein
MLWLILFYTKITYALVGLPLLFAMAWFPPLRRAAVAAGALSLASMAVIELLWSGTDGYIGDIRTAIAATGAVRDGPIGLIATVANNVAGVVIFGSVLLLSLLRKTQWTYLLIALYAAAAGILLDRHNSQGPGLLTFIPGALISLLAPRRGAATDRLTRPELDGVLLIAAYAVPVAAAAFVNLAYHFVAAYQVSEDPNAGTKLAGILAPQPPTSTSTASLNSPASSSLCGAVDPAPILEVSGGQIGFDASQYFAVLREGANLLQGHPSLQGTVLTLDAGGNFAPILGRRAPRGVDLFPDADITISQNVHLPARVMLGDVDVIMVPKVAIKYGTLDLLRRLYGPYIRSNYTLAGRSPCWDAYRRRSAVEPL